MPTLKPIVSPAAMPTLLGSMVCAKIVVVAKEPIIEKPTSTTAARTAAGCVTLAISQIAGILHNTEPKIIRRAPSLSLSTAPT